MVENRFIDPVRQIGNLKDNVYVPVVKLASMVLIRRKEVPLAGFGWLDT